MKKSKLIPFEQFKKSILSDPEVKAAYDALEAEFQIADQMIAARIKKKMTQEQLANKAGTAQAVISRLEGMDSKPSITLLRRVAQALGTKFTLTIG